MHARSVVGCAIDEETGEVHRRRLAPDNREIESWIRSLPLPWKVMTYEAGPTGFGLARHLIGAEIDTVVAAPSKLQRPTGDRIKTDARDALHLARLLKLGEIVEVTVPSIEREAARNLVRGRDDARADAMRARHRVSKLLLRQGIVYSRGATWTQTHDRFLRAQTFISPAIQITYDSAYLLGISTRQGVDGLVVRVRLDQKLRDLSSRITAFYLCKRQL